MKTLLFAAAILALGLPLRADNWLENGDFNDGINHWYGGGRSPADLASDNPMDKPNPFTSKGLIVPLKDLDWIKVAQDFKGRLDGGVLTITYMVSPDLAFSDKKEDYQNIPDHIGFDGWRAFDTSPGEWVVFVSDFGTSRGTYYSVRTKLGSSEPQTFRARVKRLTPLEDKTLALAFPPGKGTLVVLSVSLTDN